MVSPLSQSAVTGPEQNAGLVSHGPTQVVLIAGGGIAGLATALALARRGLASHVFERRTAFAEEGAGIQIGPNGTRVLAELGVADLLEPLAAKPDAIVVMDGRNGTRLTRLPLGDWMLRRYGSPYWTAHRADLHGALAQKVLAEPLVRLSMGTDILSFRETGSGVLVETGAAGQVAGDALVVADGLWSTSRAVVCRRTTAPEFTGRAALRAILPADALPSALDAKCTHVWLCAGAHVVHYPVRAANEVAVVVIIDDRVSTTNWSDDVLPAWLRSHMPSVPPVLDQLLSQPKAWRKWSLYTLPEGGAAPWTFGRVALIGDAAHPVLPFLAQGGVLALEDAVVLAQSMASKPGDIPSAFVEFERRRRPRAKRVAHASRRNGQLYHLSGMLAAARNTTLRQIAGARLMAKYDWLYGWELEVE